MSEKRVVSVGSRGSVLFDVDRLVRVCELFVACVRVCVWRACVRACARVCVRVQLCACVRVRACVRACV